MDLTLSLQGLRASVVSIPNIGLMVNTQNSLAGQNCYLRLSSTTSSWDCPPPGWKRQGQPGGSSEALEPVLFLSSCSSTLQSPSPSLSPSPSPSPYCKWYQHGRCASALYIVHYHYQVQLISFPAGLPGRLSQQLKKVLNGTKPASDQAEKQWYQMLNYAYYDILAF